MMEDETDKIVIRKDKLKLILAEKKDYIGTSKGKEIGEGLGFLVSCISSLFLPNKIARIGLASLTGAYLVYKIFLLIKAFRAGDFNSDALYTEIDRSNIMEKHPHSIIVIKDRFNNHSNRFLVYYDNRWDCWLFPNYKTLTESEAENIANIGKRIAQDLKTEAGSIAFLDEKVHTKFSQSEKREKTYDHRFYNAILTDYPALREDSFSIEGKDYRWMSIAEMEADKVIMDKNSDIVGFVKDMNT